MKAILPCLKPLGVCILGLTVALGASQSVVAQDTAAIVETSEAVANANWADNVTITIDEDANSFNFSSDGIPSHGFADKYLIPIDPSNQPFAGQPVENFDIVRGLILRRRPLIQISPRCPFTRIQRRTRTLAGSAWRSAGRISLTITKTPTGLLSRWMTTSSTITQPSWMNATGILWRMAAITTITAFQFASRLIWMSRVNIPTCWACWKTGFRFMPIRT